MNLSEDQGILDSQYEPTEISDNQMILGDTGSNNNYLMWMAILFARYARWNWTTIHHQMKTMLM